MSNAKKAIQAAAGAGGGTGSYIAIGGSTSTVYLLDHNTPGTATNVSSYSVGGTVAGLDFSPDNQYLAVGNAGGNEVVILNVDHSDGSLSFAASYNIADSSTIAEHIRWSPDGSYLAVPHNGTTGFTLLSFSGGSLSFEATYSVQGRGMGCDWSSDSAYIAVAHDGSTVNLTLLNHSSGSISLAATYQFHGDGNGENVRFTPDDNYLVCAHESGINGFAVTTLDHTTSGSLSFSDTENTSNDRRDITITADGNYVFSTGGAGAFKPPANLYSRSGGTLTQQATYAIPSSGDGYGCAFNEDGTYIALSHTQGADFTLLDHTTAGSLSVAQSGFGVSGTNGLSCAFTRPQ